MPWARLLLLFIVLAAPRLALAQARLIVLTPQEQPPRPTLVEALRLHLHGTVQVESKNQPFAAESAASRVALATAIVGREQAQFAIWLESAALDDGSTLFALYVVGGRPGRAVVEVVHLPAETDGPDVDRTLALKASDIIEAALMPAAVLAPLPAASPPTKPPAISPTPPSSATRHLGLELSGALRNSSSVGAAEMGVGLGASALLVAQPLELDARLAALLLSDSVIREDQRRVRISETDFQVGVGLRSPGQVQLGARLDADLRLLRAEGFVAGQRSGSALVWVPSLAAGPELRIGLGRRMSFAAHVSAEWMVVRQSFVVDGATVADLGRLRGNAQLSLIFFVL